MQLNNLYFGKPLNFENVNAFLGDTLQGFQLSSGSLVTLSSQPLIVETQAVANASYSVCIYDQNGTQIDCAAGNYEGQSTYAASFPVDARFHQGTYWVEGTLYGNLPDGNFMIVEEKTMTVRSSPLFPLIILALLIIGAGVIVVRRMSKRPREKRQRRARRSLRRSRNSGD